jgi:hypothetical protein
MKTCRKCLKVKKISEFHNHRNMKDGHLNFCKLCVQDRIREYRLNNIEKLRKYDKKRWKKKWKNKEYRSNRLEYHKKWRKFNKIKISAQNAIRNKIKSRPCLCELCGDKNKKILGHHQDYSKQLQVIWLCPPCHYKVHHEKNKT